MPQNVLLLNSQFKLLIIVKAHRNARKRFSVIFSDCMRPMTEHGKFNRKGASKHVYMTTNKAM